MTDVLKATITGDAIIGSMASIHAPGSGYVLLHHVMGETDSVRNVWSHVEGGMGSVSLAISKAAREAGVLILTNAEVSQLMIKDSGEVNGVLMVDGTRVHSSIVLSNATPYKTFTELVPQNVLPDDFIHAIKCSDYNSGVTKINIAIDKLPEFHCCKSSHLEMGPQHTATIHIGSESIEEIGSACQDAWNGLPSQRPVMEMTIPSSLDKTISPPAIMNLIFYFSLLVFFELLEDENQFCSANVRKILQTVTLGHRQPDPKTNDGFITIPVKFIVPSHVRQLSFHDYLGSTIVGEMGSRVWLAKPCKHVVSLFTQYTPYKPSDGSWEDPKYREAYEQKCFNLIGEYSPGFSSSVIGYDMLTPPDLEREFGLTGGNIFHGAMGLDSLFLMRPVKGWSNYRTPVRGLYLCGSGSHPGGGVTGAPGRNSAHVVLHDVKKQSC
ncbi:hypothetical protein ACOSP7_022869 [Xanthoceras sorbifolium]